MKLHASIDKHEIKKLFVPLQKNIHFTFNSEIYQRCDSVVIGPIFTSKFIVVLGKSLIQTLSTNLAIIKKWRLYFFSGISSFPCSGHTILK